MSLRLAGEEFLMESAADQRYVNADGDDVSAALRFLYPLLAYRNVDDSYLEFYGATNWEKGGFVKAFGGQNPTNPGYVQMHIGDKSAGATPASYFQVYYMADGQVVLRLNLDKDGKLALASTLEAPSGVHMVGAKQGAGRRMERVYASWTADGVATSRQFTNSWDNAFASILSGFFALQTSDTTGIKRMVITSLTTTSITVTVEWDAAPANGASFTMHMCGWGT